MTSAWADQHLLASVLLLVPVAMAALTVGVLWWHAALAPQVATVPTLTPAQRRRRQVLSVPMRRPDLPGRPRPRAPGRR